MGDRMSMSRAGIDPSRRDFLKAGTLGTIGLGLAGRASASDRPPPGAVILVMMVGGPGAAETFDPKPDAPSEYRGPFGSIDSAVPGVRVCEHLPEVARRMDRLTIVRALHHDADPIHEAGLQIIGTGGLGADRPHLGAVAAHRLGCPFAVLPGPIGSLGMATSTGQSSGTLGPAFDPIALPQWPDFGGACRMAARLVESGTPMVVVNMARTVFARPSWDAHGREPFSSFDDQSRNLLPAFDRGFSTLVDDLEARGLLASTLVVAVGEIGRTPRINEWGGRDHWTRSWSALMAGGGTLGGRVIGVTDRFGGEPVDRPVPLAGLAATIARGLGLDPSALDIGAGPIVEAIG